MKSFSNKHLLSKYFQTVLLNQIVYLLKELPPISITRFLVVENLTKIVMSNRVFVHE